MATNTVYVYADLTRAGDVFAKLSSEDVRSCIGSELGKVLRKEVAGKGPGDQEQATVGTPSTARLGVAAVGDDRDAGRITVALSTQGLVINLVIDVVFVRVKRVVAAMVFFDVISPFNAALRAKLTRTVATRLRAAFPSG